MGLIDFIGGNLAYSAIYVIRYLLSSMATEQQMNSSWYVACNYRDQTHNAMYKYSMTLVLYAGHQAAVNEMKSRGPSTKINSY